MGVGNPALREPQLNHMNWPLCCPKEMARRKTQEAAPSSPPVLCEGDQLAQQLQCKDFQSPQSREAVKSRELACSRLQCNTFASSAEGPGTPISGVAPPREAAQSHRR